MDYHYFKNLLNQFYARYVGFDKWPTFFDIDQTVPSLNTITEHFPVIKHEIESVLAKNKNLPRYHDIAPGEAKISGLEPGKSFPLDEGPNIGYLRYHFRIHIPKNNPPQIIVNNQPYTWREGEAVLFDDSWAHQVVNNSDDYRAVLIIDVLRPLPWLPTLVNQFSTNVIARYTYGRTTMKRAAKFGSEIKPLVH